jgi:cytochrome c553
MNRRHQFTGLVAGVALAVLGGHASAEPSSKVAWTLDTLHLVGQADAAKGKAIALRCEGCHTAAPGDATTENPDLRGQRAEYLFKQLQDYKDGSRANPIMTGMAEGLSEQEMAEVSAYYSQQEAPDWRKAFFVADTIDLLVVRGDGKRILPPCKACHESDGSGQKIDVPAIGGQKAAYLEQTLLDYKSGKRHNDLYSRMRWIARELSADEIKQLARYYGGADR